MSDRGSDRATRVGPVLDRGSATDAVVAAIRALNADVEIEHHGSYLRLLVPHRCVVTREAIEKELGRAFRLPGDLELLMPSFKGHLSVDEDRAVWTARFVG
jgi:toluene monooxygenase system protein D